MQPYHSLTAHVPTHLSVSAGVVVPVPALLSDGSRFVWRVWLENTSHIPSHVKCVRGEKYDSVDGVWNGPADGCSVDGGGRVGEDCGGGGGVGLLS